APYVQAIERTDEFVGRLLKAIRARKTYAQEDWLILASTDHGGSGKSHGKDIPEHRTIFVLVSGAAAARGRIEPAPAIVDIAPTALHHLGVPIQARWKMDGRAVGLTAQPAKTPILVGHRGLMRHAPENTLAGFAACLDLGLGLELDVRRTRDGHLVV